MEPQHSWEQIAARKRKERESRIHSEWILPLANYHNRHSLIDIPATCGILSPRELEITSKYDAVDVVERIRDHSFTVEEVVVAFCKRAAIAHQLVNCLTEIFFAEAISTARNMDADRLANPDKPLPPLFGLPISLKDSFTVPGFDASIGFVSLVDKPSVEHSALLALLKDLGAVFFCKTNVPQTMMTADSDNNVFGRTLNPWNTKLTAGGSTGGEGALIALRGSILGIGTDIAGSIRIPSLSNGIYGFKPSANVIPFSGQQDPVPPGMPGIVPSAGPMATSMRSCHFVLEAIYRAEPWRYDAECIHIPWTGAYRGQKTLRIGLAIDDGLYTPSPPMRRALKETSDKLRKAGMELIPVRLSNVGTWMETIWGMYSLDGAQTAISIIQASGEPLVPSVAMTGLVATPAKTLSQYMELNFERQKARDSFTKLWSSHDLDALLLPPAPHTAVPLDTWKAISYTALFNLLDCPSCIIPVGHVNATDLIDPLTNAKYGPRDEEEYKLYTGPEDYMGAPIAVQLVGQPQEDEKLASYAVMIDETLKHQKRADKL